MRQIGTLADKDHARRFADYLLTQGVDVKAEQESAGWGIWVRDENQLERARAELEKFENDPHQERYQAAARSAAEIRRTEQAKAEQIRRNTHDMTNRWQRPLMQRRPLTVVLVALSLFVSLTSNFGAEPSLASHFKFAQIRVTPDGYMAHVPWREIQQGQLWRLITPVFVHFGTLHVAFNCYMLFMLGGIVEERRGTWRYAALILTLAVVSNVVQYAYSENPNFGGLSGVVYGAFGFIWMRMQFDPRSGFYLDSMTILILIAWLFIAMTGRVGNIANAAHVAGLLTGMALGYLPLLFRRTKK